MTCIIYQFYLGLVKMFSFLFSSWCKCIVKEYQWKCQAIYSDARKWYSEEEMWEFSLPNTNQQKWVSTIRLQNVNIRIRCSDTSISEQDCKGHPIRKTKVKHCTYDQHRHCAHNWMEKKLGVGQTLTAAKPTLYPVISNRRTFSQSCIR